MVLPNDRSKLAIAKSTSSSDVMKLAQASIDRAGRSRSFHGKAQSSARQEFDAFAQQLRGALQNQRDERSGSAEFSTCRGQAHALNHTKLGRFRLIRPIGCGAFGIVLLAFDPRLQREVALKIPRPETLTHKETRQRVLREARGAAVLNHPGIVPVYEVGHVGPIWYIASAYCEGPNLHDWLQPNPPLLPRQAAELVSQIADAVQHAHSRGILHRDIKPSNVLLTCSEAGDSKGSPAILLTDFGLSARLQASTKSAVEVGLAGTLPYMSPEQTKGDPTSITTASDVYALGAILFELLSGRPPFIGETESELIKMIREQVPPSLRSFHRDAPVALDAICQKCLSKDPHVRYTSAAKLADDLRRYLAGECVDAQNVGTLGRVGNWCQRHPAVTGLMASLASAILLGVGASLWQWQRAEEGFQLASQHLEDAQSAVVNLAWALEDSEFWKKPFDESGDQVRSQLSDYFERTLRVHDEQYSSSVIRAAAHQYFAKKAAAANDLDAAEHQFRLSLAAWHDTLRNSENSAQFVRAAAQTMYQFGDFLRTTRNVNDGWVLIENSKLFGEFAFYDPIGQHVGKDYAEVLVQKANGRGLRHSPDVLAMYEACIQLSRMLEVAVPEEPLHRYRASFARQQQARVRWSRGEREQSLHDLTEVCLEWRRLLADYPESSVYCLHLGAALCELGSRQCDAKQTDRGCESYDQARQVLEPMIAANPQDLQAREEFGKLLLRIAEQQVHVDGSAAVITLAAGIAHLNEVVRGGEGGITVLEKLAHANREMGELRAARNENDEALAAFQTAAAQYTELRGQLPDRKQRRRFEASSYASAGALLENSGQRQRAIDAYRAAIETLEGWRGPHPRNPVVSGELERLRRRLADLVHDS